MRDFCLRLHLRFLTLFFCKLRSCTYRTVCKYSKSAFGKGMSHDRASERRENTRDLLVWSFTLCVPQNCTPYASIIFSKSSRTVRTCKSFLSVGEKIIRRKCRRKLKYHYFHAHYSYWTCSHACYCCCWRKMTPHFVYILSLFLFIAFCYR